MSDFFSKAAKVAKAVKEAAEEQNEKQRAKRERISNYEDRYRNKSVKELKEIINDDGVFFGSNSEEKQAARNVLRGRGI